MQDETQKASDEKTVEPWRAAYQWIVETMHSGREYPRRQLWEMCGIPWDTGRRYTDERNNRVFMRYVEELRDELRMNHKRVLRATGKGVYRVVPVADHVTVVTKDTKQAIRHDIRRGLKNLDALDTSAVDRAEIDRRDRVQDQLVMIDAMVKKDIDRENEKRRLREAAENYQRKNKR